MELPASKVGIPVTSTPPNSRTCYIVDQLEGERITIPGSKGVFRILASSDQTDGRMAVFSGSSVLAEAPGFHWHAETHDIFLVTKGFLKLWNGEKCRIMGPGDFAYVPPVIHNPEPLGPITETLGLVSPGDWVDFFRHVGEPYRGIITSEQDTRHLASMLNLPTVMVAVRDRFDVHFKPDYSPPPVSDWLETENTLPGSPLQPYFLRANTGPRWMLAGIMSRPFINASQCGGKFSISSIESSSAYCDDNGLFSGGFLTFPTVDHCLCVMEGELRVGLKGHHGAADPEDSSSNDVVGAGQMVVICAGRGFKLGFGSRYVRVISFANGVGIESLIQDAGSEFAGYVLPDEAGECDQGKLQQVCEALGVHRNS